MKRTLKDYAVITLKGIAMGAADVVPGVSGGTIAFIAGIYDELINSIKNIDAQCFKYFFTGKFKAFWNKINGNFLLALILGIGISIFSLAKLITVLLNDYPILVWAFFFGLVLASTWFVAKDIKEWNWKTILSFIIGAGVAYYITVASPAETPNHPAFIFLCGAIAICAMILPGISGSFILLLMGKYAYIMEAVSSFNLLVLGIFAVGAFLGITTFSHLLSYALRRFRAITLALLTGFMLGSLNKVWPWKETVETYVDSHGITKPLVESNIAPNEFVWQAILLAIVGFFLVYFLEKLSQSKPQR